MVKFKLLLLILLFITKNSISQESFELKCTIKDSLDSPIEWGTFFILTPEDSSFIQAIQFWDGKVEIQGIERKDILIKITAYGFMDFYQSQILGNSENEIDNLGDIILERNSNDLEEVDLVYKTPLFKREADKLVVNVEGTILSERGTVVDVLKSTPNVIIKSDGEIYVVGRGSAILYLDGQRLNSINMLFAISAKDVQKIYVIKTPSSKYDAEGNAVVEIITRKAALNGYQGSIYFQGIKRTNYFSMYGGSISYRKNRWK